MSPRRRGPEEYEPDEEGLFAEKLGRSLLEEGLARMRAFESLKRLYLSPAGAPPVLGETYEPNADAARLGDQFGRVRALMEDGAWRTLQEISAATGDPEASASARLRDMRRAGYTVHRERVGPGRGTWRYRAERKIS